MFNAYAAAQQFIAFIMLAHDVQNYCPVSHAYAQELFDQDALHRSEMRRLAIYDQAASSYPQYVLDNMNGRPCCCSDCTAKRQMWAAMDDEQDFYEEDYLDQLQADLDLDLFLAFTEHEDAEQSYYGSPAWLDLEN